MNFKICLAQAVMKLCEISKCSHKHQITDKTIFSTTSKSAIFEKKMYIPSKFTTKRLHRVGHTARKKGVLILSIFGILSLRQHEYLQNNKDALSSCHAYCPNMNIFLKVMAT